MKMLYLALVIAFLVNQETIITIDEPILPSYIVTTKEFLCDGQSVLVSHITGLKSDGYPKIIKFKIGNKFVSKKHINIINELILGRTIDSIDITGCKKLRDRYNTFYILKLSDFDGKQIIRSFVSISFRSTVLQDIQERKGVMP